MVKAIVVVTIVSGSRLDALTLIDNYKEQLFVVVRPSFPLSLTLQNNHKQAVETLNVSTPSSRSPLLGHRPSRDSSRLSVGPTTGEELGKAGSGLLGSVRAKSRPISMDVSSHPVPQERSVRKLEDDSDPKNQTASWGAKSKSYQLAQYQGFSDDLGETCALIHAKFIRRSRIARE